MESDVWEGSVAAVLEAQGVDRPQGLSSDEVLRRRARFGPNRLREVGPRPLWTILAHQFASLIVLLLGAATVLSFVLGDWKEGIAILVVILLNAAIGFFTEWKAVRSMEGLRRLGTTRTRVRREGATVLIPADELVPGDVVIVEAGDIATADMRLIEASRVRADESTLTGESVPVEKHADPETGPVDGITHANMLYRGTAVTLGSGEAVVVGTGMATELGRISELAEDADDADRTTHLERVLARMAHRLVWLTLALTAAVAVVGVLAGRPTVLMIETAVALAVAAIPEGLAIVATLALARGLWRLSRRHALVNRLSAVETLGAVNVIATDKTGTLTENRMTVTRVWDGRGETEITATLDGAVHFTRDGAEVDVDPLLARVLETGALCNNASLEHAVGDPMEVALLAAAASAGIDLAALQEARPEVREEAFDPTLKMMATIHRDGDRHVAAVKGAPEAVLEVCTSFPDDGGDALERWRRLCDRHAEEGLRLLAIASRDVDDVEDFVYRDLELQGVVGLVDPPRLDVRPAMDACRAAGIRVLMLTGDHPRTAESIARAVGLVGEGEAADVIYGPDFPTADEWTEADRRRALEAPVFSRVSPRQKLDVIRALQESGACVAMLGDGVNDAPALRRSDIGVAMGQRGTQVAREAAAMVLEDDSFASVVVAVGQGRVIFGNIRKFVVYLLSCNLSEVLVVGLAALASTPLPILPLQILFLNLVTDVFPALALGVGEGDAHVMSRPPRDPKEDILTAKQWRAVGGYGALVTGATLGAFAWAWLGLGLSERATVTVSFLTLAIAQVLHVFNMRAEGSSIWLNEVTRNRWVWGAVVLCLGLIAIAIFSPIFAAVLSVERPSGAAWGIVALMSSLPLVIGQVLKIRGGGPSSRSRAAIAS